MLKPGGVGLRTMPVRDRREILVRPMEDAPDGLVLAEAFEDGRALFWHACTMGLEGVVSKRLDSAYRSGRALIWLKAKCSGYTRAGDPD